MRERQALGWMRPDSGSRPEFWDVEGKGGMGIKEKQPEMGQSTWKGSPVGIRHDPSGKEVYMLEDGEELVSRFCDYPSRKKPTIQSPLAVIPVHQPKYTEPPVPQSNIPYFPNHLAYRSTALQAPPARFHTDNLDTINQLEREQVDVVAMIRMPQREMTTDPEEGEEVIREWGGMEVGIVRMDVASRI